MDRQHALPTQAAEFAGQHFQQTLQWFWGADSAAEAPQRSIP